MNKNQQQVWQENVLDAFAEAIGGDPTLRQLLVFKGARVLARHLPAHDRVSLDSDAAFSGDSTWTAERLQHSLQLALRRSFASARPLRLELESLTVHRKPPKPHPRGWDG